MYQNCKSDLIVTIYLFYFTYFVQQGKKKKNILTLEIKLFSLCVQYKINSLNVISIIIVNWTVNV